MLFRSITTDVPPPEPRRRALDNPRMLAVVVVGLVALLVGLFWLPVWLPDRTVEVYAPLLSDVVLYTFYAVDLAILAALLFVLARNLLKLWVEQRRAAPFARFRAKLVAALLALTIVPAVLVLISGSEIFRTSVTRWFSAPVEEVLDASKNIAQASYAERQDAVALWADELARSLPVGALTTGAAEALQPSLKADLATMRDGMIEVYRAVTVNGQADVTLLYAVASPSLPRDHVQASADRLAKRATNSARAESTEDDLDSGGLLVRTAQPVRDPAGQVVGAVVVSELISADLKAQQRRAISAYEQYRATKALKGPLQGVYLALFLMVTLLILVSATWLGLYVAKRITRPVQMLAEGAKAIGAGRFDLRIEPETSDELGSLVESFNTMAAELRTSQEKLEQSRHDLERKNVEVEARRRYIETILERVATGVISLDARGNISTVNGAAERLLGLDAAAVGRPAAVVLGREDLLPLMPLVEATRRREPGGIVQEITLAHDGREIHLAAAATVLTGDDGRAEGGVLVLDDVTPLIRAQRVAAWRDVARRLAHEIKNPLTPIQLSAERLRRNFASAAAPVRALVEECTDAIVTEVEALKGLVDEFAQFARLRGPRTVPSDVNRLVEDTLRLYSGVLQQGTLRVERDLARDVPNVRLDGEQMRQVIINLVDNALEALGGPSAPARPDGRPPTIVVATNHDARNGVVRLVVTDNGPGVPPADRDKLFMPYYSTKGRGSGLGLAIVRRIVAEHGGGVEVGDAQPYGTVFTVELPAT
jgi:two-component system nitrogen regulation sensor histidine kinase NtrY